MGNLKKYYFLEKGDEIIVGDEELLLTGEWREVNDADYICGYFMPMFDDDDDDDQMVFRRPIPFDGPEAFVVNYSPLFRVVFDPTGMTEEEVAVKMYEMAKAKLEEGFRDYMKEFYEAIDWEWSGLDEVSPYDPELDKDETS